MKTWIVSYADAAFLTAEQRLMESAARVGIDERRSWSRAMLEQTWLYRLHRDILDRPRGGGYWLWKPFIIAETLREMAAGDLLIYADAGIEIAADLSPLFPIVTSTDVLVFAGHYDDVGAPGPNSCGKWTKRDGFVAMGCDEPRYYEAQMADASFVMLTKGDRAIAFVSDWLAYCRQSHLLTDAPNVCGLPDPPGFLAHRHDQSILSLLAHREGVELYRHPSQHGNHLKLEGYREPGEWTRHPYGSKGIYHNSPYPTLLHHHRGALGQTDLRVQISRSVRAPRDQVFQAWMRSDLLRQWSLGGLAVIEAERDLRAGGGYRVLLASGGEPRTELTGTYLEVDDPARLVYTWQTRPIGAGVGGTAADRPIKPRPVQQVRVAFASRGDDETIVDLTHEPFPTEKARENYAPVWPGFLDILAHALESR